MAERCRHRTQRPVSKKAGFITLRCSSCGKGRSVKGLPCPNCGPKWDAYNAGRRASGAAFRAARNADEREAAIASAPPTYSPGCEGCFEGLTTPDWVPPCCCFQRRKKCGGCESVSDRMLPHICTVETADEIDAELALAFMDAPRTRDAQDAASKAGLYDYGEGFRAPKYG